MLFLCGSQLTPSLWQSPMPNYPIREQRYLAKWGGLNISFAANKVHFLPVYCKDTPEPKNHLETNDKQSFRIISLHLWQIGTISMLSDDANNVFHGQSFKNRSSPISSNPFQDNKAITQVYDQTLATNPCNQTDSTMIGKYQLFYNLTTEPFYCDNKIFSFGNVSIQRKGIFLWGLS